MTSVFSWQNSISLCPASFCILRPNLPGTPGVSWLPTFAFQSPIMKMTSFLGVSLKGLVGLHRTVQLQLLQRYWLGHRLGLLWYWMVCLGNEQRSFCRFWDCIEVLRFGAVWMLITSLFSKQSTAIQQKHMQAACYFKMCSSCIKREKETSEVNFNNIFCSTQYISNIINLISNQYF